MELLHPVVRRFQERLAHGVAEPGVRVVLLQGLVQARDHVGGDVCQHEATAYSLGLAVLHEEGLSKLRGGGPSRLSMRGVVDVALHHEDAWPLACLGLVQRGAHACEAVGRVERARALFEAVASHQRHQPPEGGLRVAGRAQVAEASSKAAEVEPALGRLLAVPVEGLAVTALAVHGARVEEVGAVIHVLVLHVPQGAHRPVLVGEHRPLACVRPSQAVSSKAASLASRRTTACFRPAVHGSASQLRGAEAAALVPVRSVLGSCVCKVGRESIQEFRCLPWGGSSFL